MTTTTNQTGKVRQNVTNTLNPIIDRILLFQMLKNLISPFFVLMLEKYCDVAKQEFHNDLAKESDTSICIYMVILLILTFLFLI